jgi:hypothetical protein
MKDVPREPGKSGGWMKLIRVEDFQGRQTFVNADRVNFICDYGSGKTEINFGGKEATVYVEMEVSEVAKMLLKASSEK